MQVAVLPYTIHVSCWSQVKEAVFHSAVGQIGLRTNPIDCRGFLVCTVQVQLEMSPAGDENAPGVRQRWDIQCNGLNVHGSGSLRSPIRTRQVGWVTVFMAADMPSQEKRQPDGEVLASAAA